MANRHFIAPPPCGPSALGTGSCPPVADLIHYALGQAPPDDRRLIESHLGAGDCGHCRRWIDLASRYRAEAGPEALKKNLPPAALRSPPAPSDPTPVPHSATWEREALRELEQRLGQVE